MADYRAIAVEATGFGNVEIGDADKLLAGIIAPASGDLTIGGATAADGVVVDAGNDLSMSGDGVFNLAGTGNLNVTASGTHVISGGDLDVDVSSNFSGNMVLSGGADLTAGAGSALSGFDSIEGILSGNLLDKTANETISGQYIFQGATKPNLIVQAVGGEPVNTLLFQVQNSGGSNLFSVDTEGDVVIAGGETVAGTTVYTGDITLGDGNNTVQIGAATTPAQGDNVYINTTGTTDGQFSLTTEFISIDTSGNLDTDGDITLNDGGTIGSTNNGDIDITPNGTGEVNITNFAGCGTNCSVWEVNQDAVAGTAEDAGVAFPAGDGANVQNWQIFTDSSAEDLIFRYKQDPTDPADFTEAGYQSGLTLAQDGTVQFFGNMSTSGTQFQFSGAGTVLAGGNLTLNAGANDILATAATVDLATSVTTLDVPDQTGFSIAGTALTTTLWTATGVDTVFGGPASNADAYHTHSGTGAACGTTCNQWEINNDAVGTTAEDVGVMFPGGDGTNVQNFQFFNDTSTPEMVLRYKQNPTDPADMAEAGYTTLAQFAAAQATFSVNVDAAAGLDVTGAALTVDANGIDSGGSIDLAGTLSFDAAGTIDTSGNNDLTINTGTQDVLVTADTVDLQTNVTTLDVPSNTGFSIGGTALTTTSFTATAADIIFGNGTGDADPYHTHSSAAAADQIVIDGLTTTAMSQYQAGYVSANDTITPTDASSATGTYLTATFAGVYDATAGEVVNTGKIEVQFDSGLAPAPVAGDPAILSWVNSGQYRNRPPATGSGHFFTWAGIVLDASTYGTNQRCTIVIQPSRPIKR